MMIYIASPYSAGHADKLTVKLRFENVALFTARGIKAGHCCYSPIVHNHVVNERLGEHPGWGVWRRHDLNMLRFASWFIIYGDKDWEISRGIAEEQKFAEAAGIPLFLFSTEVGTDEAIYDSFWGFDWPEFQASFLGPK
jgi:hypothetical protein